MKQFAFIFHMPIPSGGEHIECNVFGKDYEDACNTVLDLNLPINAVDLDDFGGTLKSVFQTDEQE